MCSKIPSVVIGVWVHLLLLFKFILDGSSCHGSDVGSEDSLHLPCGSWD